jgi:outer membrane protein OmpA-like peptidoglycan-associated protein
VIDLDLQTFKQTKSVIESAFIYFLVDKDNFATEGFAALSRLPDELRRCLDSAKRLGFEATIEIHGHADAVGSEARNADLSQRRANAVHAFS